MKLNLKTVKIKKPKDMNVIIGQAHFIKTVEDIYEVLVGSMPLIKFGIAFCEASGKCLVRTEGNAQELIKISAENALLLGCGHLFFITIDKAYPINVLNQIKNVPEVCRVFCATANPIEAIVTETEQGKAFLGVVDGFSPAGLESENDKKERQDLLRNIGYKL
ncbi:MAG: adenosine-specific kinase [Candidatus Omnitrophica bacterium]|nr:adenosine-specific kinase [Candidatus Omnitrophota bacterium]MCK5288726.1 adenosine-specific kinase [Candidatus Omnitrophota bacterium]